ncbi:MAG: DUF1294 domain-containing protein [Dorea sp.]|jgi:uncharacterized membrane protein YsdA (DUF1294 family)|nr:DUF1294 domain-containing protein [Dorea sp.]
MNTGAVFIYLAVMNVLGFAIFGYDKRRAMRRRWRVSEKKLLCVALLGGSIGAYIGMQVFRHKTRHWKFRVGIPGIILIQYGFMILKLIS